MKQYQVTGMSCAACSARVEKAVSQVEGVESCSVSLLTNSMGVEGIASPEASLQRWRRWVRRLGKGTGQNSQTMSASAQEEMLKDKETPVLRRRLIAVPLFSDPHDVRIHGTYHVELAPAGGAGREPCGPGADPASFDHRSDGHQSEVFHQWI